MQNNDNNGDDDDENQSNKIQAQKSDNHLILEILMHQKAKKWFKFRAIRLWSAFAPFPRFSPFLSFSLP